MSRPTLHSLLRPLVAIVACLTVLALVQRTQDNDSSAATPGLSATFSGKAFGAANDGRAPVMRLAGLRQGQATSGTVTVRNPGPGTRYFWLTPGKVSEKLGAGGGRLSNAISLTVMDVTDIASPTIVYRGPLRYVGARPLGFLDPGARRSFSFVAELPTGGRSPVAPAVDPYRGARASIDWSWRSLAGRPDAPAPEPVRPKRDRTAPKLTFDVPGRQQLLQRRALALTVRCDEDCAVRPRASVAGSALAAGASRGIQRNHALTVRFTGPRVGDVTRALVAGRKVRIRVAVQAYDRSGNSRRDSHVITLRPRG